MLAVEDDSVKVVKKHDFDFGVLSLVGPSIGCSDGSVRMFDFDSLENELVIKQTFAGEGCCLNHDFNDVNVLSVNDQGDVQIYSRETAD